MSDSRVRLGRRGEQLAAAELERRGCEIVERNWRCQFGEVDIVARCDGVWAFVEVRTRRGTKFGSPEESLTPTKQARMAAVAEYYAAEHDLGDVTMRLDLVAVEMDRQGRLVRLEVLEDVVEAV